MLTALAATLASLALILPVRDRSAQGLTAAGPLARVYDAIFDLRSDEMPALVAAACPPAPAEACQVLEAVAVWWRIRLDPLDTTRDALFESKAEAAIAATSAWTRREPNRAEAWFYAGAAYGARAQWRVLRGARLAAARDGMRIKNALERVLALDSGLTDAYFGIGLYHYYADVAPRALKMLRWLLLLPGGNRAEGLAEMVRGRDAGVLVRSEADYQLHLIYLWYERDPGRALALIRGLQARHPRNPHFWQSAAEIEDVYLHDASASLRTWGTLLEAARAGEVAEAAMAETTAHLGMAQQLDRLDQSDTAEEHLRAVIAAQPAAPFGASARAHLQLGRILDRLGHDAEAAVEYRRAIAEAGANDPLKIADEARRSLGALIRHTDLGS